LTLYQLNQLHNTHELYTPTSKHDIPTVIIQKSTCLGCNHQDPIIGNDFISELERGSQTIHFKEIRMLSHNLKST